MSASARKPVIAIDGPAGSGKSTLARLLACRLGLRYIDSGAMYRAVALAALRKGVDFSDPEALTQVARSAHIHLEGTCVFLDGEEVENQIRTPDISRSTSQQVANVLGVRQVLVERQRQMGLVEGVVMEGRDIGTVVFPEADLKIYFEVSVEERMRRRIKDWRERGIPFDEAELRCDLERRDAEDRGRVWGALLKAADAVEVHGDGKSVEELLEEIMLLWEGRRRPPAGPVAAL